ncbi:MAG: sialate O-acetylesterase [Paludibacter sp.]
MSILPTAMNLKKIHILIFSFFIFHFSLIADIRLPKLISDGIVLQHDSKVNVWGWADANEKVSIIIDTKTYETIADTNGNWNITLKPHKAGGPYSMSLNASNRIEIKNILFGDVWLCSGQSNMELPVSRVKPLYIDEINSAVNSFIRFFNVPQKYNFKSPETDYLSGSWQEINPQTISSCSAVAYFFAANLYAKHNMPIGIINASLGGSPIQAWMSEEALKAFPDDLNEAYKWRDNELIKQTEKCDNLTSNNWYTEANNKDAGHGKTRWSNPDIDDSDWQTLNIPGYWNDKFPDIKNGVVWLRKEFFVSKSDAGEKAFLNLGRIVDADSAFINGKCVGNVTYQYPPRWYKIPESILKEGKNVIVVRVVSNAGKGGFVPDKPYELTIGSSKINLKGEWKMKQGCSMPVLPGQTFIRWKPMGLYNAMIAPLKHFTKKGIVWYQGESNTYQPEQYAKLLPAMIHDWHLKFNQPELPFIYAQLPNFMEAKTEPSESNWAMFRHMQASVLTVKNTAMSVNIDAGDWNDIHPMNKKVIGERLAKLAQKLAYNEKITASAPMVKNVILKNRKVIISFSRSGHCLKTSNGPTPQEFAIAGANNKFVWAKAKISGNKVIVSSENILQPVKVRYAWADNPDKANLIDSEGNFVSPFEVEVSSK